MTLRTKRTILALLAIASLFFTAAIEWNRRPAALVAQGETATVTPSVTPSITPTFTPTGTLTPTPTGTLTSTPSHTPSHTPTGTLTATPTGTLTVTPSFTPSITPSFTPIFTPSWTPTLFGTPTPFPIATPTPIGFVSPLTTPTFTPTVAVVTIITQPRKGDAVANYSPIMGTALSISYRMYEISVSPAGMDSWSWLYSSYDIISRGQLYLWDTTPFADGYYDIRLRTIRDDGNYEDFIAHKIEVRNANPPTPTRAYNDEGTLLPPAPISPTPTIRPRIVQNNPAGQGIFEPEVGETVHGFIDIIGTTNGSRANPFDRYEVAISTNGDDAWGWLYTGEEQMWQNTVYTFDTRRVPDGYYDIRLRIVYRDANYDDFILRYLNIANAGQPDPAEKYPNGIYRPKNNKTIGGVVNFVGTALDADFMRWELHWSPAGQEQWSFLIDGDRQVIRGVIARLDVSALKGAPIDVRLRVVRTDFNYSEYFVRNLNVTDPTPTPTYVPPPTATPFVPPLATPTPPLPPPPAGPEPTWTPLG